MTKVLVRGIFIPVLAVLFSCGKEDIPKPLTASFEIREVIWNPDYFPQETYDTDSVCTPEIQFIASQPKDSTIIYQWKIGTDARIFTQKDFSLNFPPGCDSIKVILSVQKKGASSNIVEAKTESRTFYFRESQVKGHFQGYFEGVTQKADVYISQNFINPQLYNSKGLLMTTNIQRFDSLFSNDDWTEKVTLHRKIYFDWANTIADGINPRVRFPRGTVSLDKDYKTLTVDLTVTEVSTLKKIPMKFKGTKVF